VEGARPCKGVCHDVGLVAEHLGADALDPLSHLGCCPTGKRHQQDTAGIGARDDELRNTVRERVGLAGASACNDQQRSGRLSLRKVEAMDDSGTLALI